MESAKPSSSAPPYSGGAGAGGKFRKPPVSRKRPSTPYDRPPLPTGNNKSDESQDGGGGWLSKLVVNPARRLIVGGATRILPSFFSKSDSSSADEYEDDLPSDHDNQDIDETGTENAYSDAKHTLELGVSRWSGEAGPSNEMDKLKNISELNIVQQDESKNSPDNLGLAKIENLLKGKQFSRDERNRLMEILNSRLVDVDKKTQTMNSNEKAKEDKRAEPETPIPRLQSNMQDEVGASPIDIARAYMGNRPLELGFNSYNVMSKDGKEEQNLDLIPSKPQIFTPSSKSSTCWPGAMVQDQRGYLTPQNQRSRYGLHNFPRTPYSRTIYSKTNPKINTLQVDRKSSHSPLTTFQQTRTPNYGQMKLSGDGGYGSVGPIRRVRNKIVTEPQSEKPSNRSSGEITSSPFVSRSFVPVFQKNQETTKREQSFKREGSPNETVRKIMEKLDRHKPTPKEKAEELKLATEWKRSSFMPKESDDTSFVKRKDVGIVFKEMADSVITKTSGQVDDVGAGPSFGFKNVTGTNEKSTFTNIKEKEKSQPWLVDNNQMNGQDLTKKPILKPISFTRPDPKQVISSENNRGFTFPFSATASSASEPPTPSILPSFPATTVIPNYTFGTKKSGERVVFSFPSTSSGGGPVDDGESDLKFNFGSDNKRVSFSSIGSDAAIAIN